MIKNIILNNKNINGDPRSCPRPVSVQPHALVLHGAGMRMPKSCQLTLLPSLSR